MTRTFLVWLFGAVLLASSAPGRAVEAAGAQTVDSHDQTFDGTWVGSGTIARPIFRTRCGNGPLIELTVKDGAAKAVFKAFAKGKARTGLKSHLFVLRGSVGTDGHLDLGTWDAEATFDLNAETGTGEGTWSFTRVVCDGPFTVRKRP